MGEYGQVAMTSLEEKRRLLVESLTRLVGAEKAEELVATIDRNITTAVKAVGDALKEVKK